MKIYLIRHGQTEGNTLKRYIGVTDEPLLPEEKNRLKLKNYPHVELIFTSPLLRCRQTAEAIYPKRNAIIVPNLSECDFGVFENKNWKELNGSVQYQEWIESNGTMAFPGGEDPKDFKERSCRAFEEIIYECYRRGAHSAAIVTHGGTIMSIMGRYVQPQREFYHWHVDNGNGYEVEIEPSCWTAEIKILQEVHALKP